MILDFTNKVSLHNPIGLQLVIFLFIGSTVLGLALHRRKLERGKRIWLYVNLFTPFVLLILTVFISPVLTGSSLVKLVSIFSDEVDTFYENGDYIVRQSFSLSSNQHFDVCKRNGLFDETVTTFFSDKNIETSGISISNDTIYITDTTGIECHEIKQ